MNNDFFDRTPAEKWELIKEAFWRIFAPRAYANLYSHYQALRNSIDEMEEEARCDVVDAENEVAACSARTANCSSESTN